MAALDDEYRRLVEEAGLPPEALPSNAFFSNAVEHELNRAMAEQHVSAEKASDPIQVDWDGDWNTLSSIPAGHLDGNTLQACVAQRLAAGAKLAPMPIAVLISGTGTNLQAIIDAIAAGSLNAEIKLVVASRPDAAGLKRAEAAGLQTLTLSKDIYSDPIVADEVIATELYRAGVAYVIMAGYMRKVHPPILATFPERVINLHPALLPSFRGLDAIVQAYERGVKVAGITIHIANAAYDQGPILAQKAIMVEETWTLEQLEDAIHALEHTLYPELIQILSEGRVKVLPDLRVAIAPVRA
ncbi:phosphoribosylglycinamide formyltransferase [Collinsella sp. zg1085]|uniref:phosphoribosylglycinamide formyltransferase n=1 Tax=Collinsella sp. zg1085 TaxID=2844380 RepID=UPI001C0E7AF8|nr:phosphoribosylglycinamide formyltransferase [Collinsella sp. zg1085]